MKKERVKQNFKKRTKSSKQYTFNCRCLISILLLLLTITISCTENNTVEEGEEEGGGDKKDELTINDISGIWENTDNNLFFISLKPNYEYSFCFSPTLMGSGKYKLQNDSIIFYNEYLQITDTAKIEKANSILYILGNISQFKSNKPITISLKFKSSSETPAPSLIGEQWQSNDLLTLGGDQKEYIDVLSQYIIKYRRVKANGIETPVKTQNWFYINRKDLIYTQISNADGTIHLYKSPFIYESLSGISSFEIDFEK